MHGGIGPSGGPCALAPRADQSAKAAMKVEDSWKAIIIIVNVKECGVG